MKSKRAEFFDDAVVSGPDQKAFEEKIYAEAQAKRWPRVAEGTGKFEGQVVIVTGAAGGQGEMEAKMIAQQGAKVYMADIEEEGLKRVEAAIIADGGEAVAFPMDVADEGSWQELVKKVVDESGRLDVLVNNAGMCQNGTVLTETRESLNLSCLLYTSLGVHRGDQHLPDRNLSGCLAVCIGACDLPSKKLRFSKEEAREKGSTI